VNAEFAAKSSSRIIPNEKMSLSGKYRLWKQAGVQSSESMADRILQCGETEREFGPVVVILNL
jgi:hypothetical protein